MVLSRRRFSSTVLVLKVSVYLAGPTLGKIEMFNTAYANTNTAYATTGYANTNAAYAHTAYANTACTLRGSFVSQLSNH